MKKFLDGAPNRVSDHIEEMISDKDFTFANYDEAAAERVTWSDYSYCALPSGCFSRTARRYCC